ncbi:helix-turn-helix transcriptional regulator [Kalamiella sp. sgz302252]|uniref:helix-turn-helix transcriptional regulator n=1 Tax=Pantoea sp. sgz302252 TaxID=3341827 RepID=UPI0036D3E5C9
MEAKNHATGEGNRLLLGAFLRKRRESLDPQALGLPRTRNRRTPGLRREEVAQLADVGVTWYTWLEQGREIKASLKTLAAIASALQCNEAEAGHLFSLAGHPAAYQTAVRVCERLSSHSQVVLDQLNPLPAVIQTTRFDILGCNQAWRQLMRFDPLSVPQEDRNYIWLAFTHPTLRQAIVDWSTLMPNMVARFRAQMGDNHDDPWWKSLLDRLLAASAEFRETWSRYEILAIDNQVKRFQHPDSGILSLRQSNWWTAPGGGGRMVVYIPDDENSTAALQKITAGC